MYLALIQPSKKKIEGRDGVAVGSGVFVAVGIVVGINVGVNFGVEDGAEDGTDKEGVM